MKSSLVGMAVAVLTMVPTYASADQKLTIVFETNTGGGAKCHAAMLPTHEKREAKRNEKITWVFANNCDGFRSVKVELRFETELVGSSKRVKGTVQGRAEARLTASKIIAPDGSKHKYTIYYDGVKDLDPELDINGDQNVPPVKAAPKPRPKRATRK